MSGFSEYTEPGPEQIIVWLDRGFSKLGVCELEKINEYNKSQGWILEKDDFEFVKRYYPMLMVKYLDGYEKFHDFINDTFTREILLEHLEDNYCPSCSSFLENKSDNKEINDLSKIENDRLELINKTIYQYDIKSNLIKKIGYDNVNKIKYKISYKYNNNQIIVTDLIHFNNTNSKINRNTRDKIFYNSNGEKIKKVHFILKKKIFGYSEINNGFTEYKYDDSGLLIEEIRGEFRVKHKYNDDKLVEEMIVDQDKYLYQYNENGKIITETVYDNFGDLTSKRDYQYLNNEEICGYYNKEKKLTNIDKYFYDNKKNIKESIYYSLLDKFWCEKCNKSVFINTRSCPPKLEFNE